MSGIKNLIVSVFVHCRVELAAGVGFVEEILHQRYRVWRGLICIDAEIHVAKSSGLVTAGAELTALFAAKAEEDVNGEVMSAN